MSSKQTTTYTCDACGEQVELERGVSSGTQPADWFALRLTRPPLADPTSKETTPHKHDLCPDCTEKVRGVISGALDVVEPEPDESDEEDDDGDDE